MPLAPLTLECFHTHLQAPGCNIYARASPENKLRIVRALQRSMPKAASAAIAKAAAQQGRSLAAVSAELAKVPAKDLAKISSGLQGKELDATIARVSRGLAATSGSRVGSPDVTVEVRLVWRRRVHEPGTFVDWRGSLDPTEPQN